jgi:hypothetical protein
VACIDLWSVTIGDMLRILFIFVSPLAAGLTGSSSSCQR